jgi:hypothetical protein
MKQLEVQPLTFDGSSTSFLTPRPFGTLFHQASEACK